MASNLTVRLDDATREKLELIALREYRTLAGQMNYFIQKGIELYLSENDLAFDINSEDGAVHLWCYKQPDHLSAPAPLIEPDYQDNHQ